MSHFDHILFTSVAVFYGDFLMESGWDDNCIVNHFLNMKLVPGLVKISF